jgi:hypothetical protein
MTSLNIVEEIPAPVGRWKKSPYNHHPRVGWKVLTILVLKPMVNGDLRIPNFIKNPKKKRETKRHATYINPG